MRISVFEDGVNAYALVAEIFDAYSAGDTESPLNSDGISERMNNLLTTGQSGLVCDCMTVNTDPVIKTELIYYIYD